MKIMIAYTNTLPKLKLVIEEERFSDDSVGYYLLVYSRDSENSINDYLQDSLDIALEQAEEEYNVSRSSWKSLL